MKAKTTDLFEALVSMKLTLDIDLLKGCYEMRPTKDEIAMIVGHVDQKRFDLILKLLLNSDF